MKQTSRILNGILILILLLSAGWGVHAWLQPSFPSTVKGDTVVPAPRELILPALSRQAYSNTVAREVTDHNLFRKQRKPYVRPKPPKPKSQQRSMTAPPKAALAPPSAPTPPPQPTAPPPQLVLTGVLLLADQKVAIFEGTYSEIRGGKLVQNLKPRRRGYKIGETLGSYRIATIDKSHATLSALSGNSLTLTVSKTPPTEKIKRSGGRLIQKSKPVANTRVPRPTTSRRVPIQKRPPSRVPPPGGSPPTVAAPGTPVPAPDSPSNPNTPQRLRQKSMGF